MKNKRLFIIAIGMLLVIAAFFLKQSSGKRSATITKISEKGIFVGDSELGFSMKSRHGKIDQEINFAWDHIELGNNYFKQGKYERAAEAFERAYSVQIASRSLSGFKLTETYEKLGRYDDAINLLNQMIEKHELSELGIQDAKEMISRLLASKETATKK